MANMNLNFSQFAALAKNYNVIPLFEELPADLDTPVTAFAKLRTKKYGFLFESVVGGEKWARYSFVGVAPRRVYSLLSGRWKILEPGGRGRILPCDKSDPLGPLRQESQGWQTYQDKNLPRFFGGLVGFMTYRMVHYFENIPAPHAIDKNIPDLSFLLMDQVVIFDNLRQVMKVVACVFIDEAWRSDARQLKKAYDRACRQIQGILQKLKRPVKLKILSSRKPGLKNPVPRSTLEKDSFCDIVSQAKAYIEAGDVFQVVLSNQFVLKPFRQDALEIYRHLRRLNPSPYMYFLEMDELKIVGASPEILVRVEDRQIALRPIAGTRPRGHTEEEDVALEAELRADPKELAEHIMLVDLGRNDVGRVAKTGTVRVDEQKRVERYSHVMHLVSQVSGQVLEDKDAWDVIRACFPAGTLSGAPKIRAMQIIEELEPVDRSLYGGAVGYVSLTGNADLAIAIRTAAITGKKVLVQAGAGIVYNSVPEKEYEESVNKARGMILAVQEG